MLWFKGFIPDSAQHDRWSELSGLDVQNVADVAKMGKTQESRAKSAILPHKRRINNVPGTKSFSFPAHCGSFFPWAHCKPTNADIGGSPVWHKHTLEKCGGKMRKVQNHGARKKNIHAPLSQVTMHLSCRRDAFVEWVEVNILGFLLPELEAITKQSNGH